MPIIIVLVGRPLNAECSGDIFFDLNYFFELCLFVFVCFFYLRFNFFYIHMLPLKYSCQKCSFSSGKKWLFSEKLFLFLDR